MSDWSFAGPPLSGPQPPTLWDRLQGIGNNIAQWYQSQPSWLQQAAKLDENEDWRKLAPSDDRIRFAMGMVGPQALSTFGLRPPVLGLEQTRNQLENFLTEYARGNMKAMDVKKEFTNRGWNIDLRRGSSDFEAFDPSGKVHYLTP